LLCINPFWLWDAGFQLSYVAVLSIVLFMKPVYNLLYVRNKLLDALWKLNAVTLAAQVLTIPITIYYFHQFPVYFLLTNIIAVPLSTIIVFGEIILCTVGALPWLSQTTGNILHWLIVLMNRFIEHMEQLPFALWQHLQINLLQLVALYGFIATISYWLFEKNKIAFIAALGCLLVFVAGNGYSFIITSRQQQLVVYNVPQHRAIDFISGSNYFFDGDEGLEKFYLDPARNLYRATHADSLPQLQQYGNCFLFNHKRIIVIDRHTRLPDKAEKIRADVVIITQNPRLYLTDLVKTIDCSQLVTDGSNPVWKVNKWRAEAAKLRLSCFSVVDNGAFVMKLR
jgi:competence protein ComEC